MFRWKWKAATAGAGVYVPCIDVVVVAPATYTCPIVPRGLRRGVLELGSANMIMIMSRGSGIAHRGAGVGPGAGVIPRRLSVN